MNNTVFKKYNVVGDDICYHHTATEPSCDRYYHGPEAHLQYEVLYLLKGQVSYIIEGETYEVREGDMIFVAPNEIHTLKIEGSRPYERIVLLFNMSILHRLMRELEVSLGAFSEGEKNLFHIIGRGEVKEYGLDKILHSIIMEDGDENRKKLSIISKLIKFVLTIDRVTQESSHTAPLSSDTLVRAVTEYVDLHMGEPIRLDTLAEELYISKSTLCHRFSDLMNMTVNKYVITKKMYRAAEMLRDGYSAQAAAEAVGYDNYTSFFYNYKRVIGVSPTVTGKTD